MLGSKFSVQLIKLRSFSKLVKPSCKLSASKQTNNNNNNSNMDALVLDFQQKEVNLEKVPIPKCVKKDEVMVQVAYAEANTTDVAIMEGRIKSSQQKLIPGRVMSGVVSKIGEQVQHIKVGDKVIVAPCMPHSLCPFCSDQKNGCCVKEPTGKLLGVDRNGGWAEYCVAPMNTVYKSPQATLQQAALLPAVAQTMCSLLSLQIQPNQEVLIMGVGLQGLLFAIMLRHNNHEKVIICEDNPERMNVVEELDLCYPIISPEQLCDMCPDVVITCGAGTSSMQQALDSINNHGLFAIYGATEELDLCDPIISPEQLCDMCPDVVITCEAGTSSMQQAHDFINNHGLFAIYGAIGENGSKPDLQLQPSEISRKRIRIQGLEGTPANATNVPSTVISHFMDVDKLGVETIPIQNFKDGLTKISTRDANTVLFEIKKDL